MTTTEPVPTLEEFVALIDSIRASSISDRAKELAIADAEVKIREHYPPRKLVGKGALNP